MEGGGVEVVFQIALLLSHDTIFAELDAMVREMDMTMGRAARGEGTGRVTCAGFWSQVQSARWSQPRDVGREVQEEITCAGPCAWDASTTSAVARHRR